MIFWPRDRSIAVRQKEAVPDFGPWSIKAGIQHVQPPSAILQNMLTVRLHLDDCPESNGALRVLPGCHQSSRLNVLESETLQQNTDPATCCVKSGGRRHNEGSVAPLIPSSNRSRTPSRHSPRIRRRTIARTAAVVHLWQTHFEPVAYICFGASIPSNANPRVKVRAVRSQSSSRLVRTESSSSFSTGQS